MTASCRTSGCRSDRSARQPRRPRAAPTTLRPRDITTSNTGTDVSDHRAGMMNGEKNGMNDIVTPSPPVGSLITANSAEEADHDRHLHEHRDLLCFLRCVEHRADGGVERAVQQEAKDEIQQEDHEQAGRHRRNRQLLHRFRAHVKHAGEVGAFMRDAGRSSRPRSPSAAAPSAPTPRTLPSIIWNGRNDDTSTSMMRDRLLLDHGRQRLLAVDDHRDVEDEPHEVRDEERRRAALAGRLAITHLDRSQVRRRHRTAA